MLYKRGLGIFLSLCGVVLLFAVYPRVKSRQVSAAGEVYNERSSRVGEQVEQALHRRDYRAAEGLLGDLIRKDPGNVLVHKALGDVYFEAGDGARARTEFRWFVHARVDGNDTATYTRYGELCFGIGDFGEAKVGYRKAISNFTGQNFIPLLPLVPDSATFGQVRALALAVDGLNNGMSDRREYLDETSRAMSCGSDLAFVRWVRADALYRCGLFADSRKLFDRTVKRFRLDERARLNRWIDRCYEFRAWDHTSGGVIGRDGKVTFTRREIPLPNRLDLGIAPFQGH